MAGEENGKKQQIEEDASVPKKEKFYLFQLGERLDQVISSLGEEAAAQIADKSVRQLRRYVSGQEAPVSVIFRLAAAAGVSLEWLMGDSPQVPADFPMAVEVLEKRLEFLNSFDAEHSTPEVERYKQLIVELIEINRAQHQNNNLPDKQVWRDASNHGSSRTIPNLLTHAGMGNGGLEHVEVDEDGHPLDLFTDGAWSFPTGIAGGFRHFKGVYALEVEGDSMEPTYAGGSTVFVDTRRKDPRSPGCFIVDYGDGLMLKRIELIGGTDQMAVISDNRDFYRSYEFPRDQVHIWGRVIAKWEWVK